MRSEVLEQMVPWMEVLENSIYDEDVCPNEFEVKFCGGNELLGVWFSSEQFQVQYLTSSGCTVSNTFSLRELDSWLEEGTDIDLDDE